MSDGPINEGPVNEQRVNEERASPRVRRLRLRKRPRFQGPSFNRMIPNILTMLGLCAGLSSIRYALDSHFAAAVIAIAIAACIDGLDGRIARLLHATSRFGAEFDSLADFLCFGVAPSFVTYLWSLHVLPAYGFIPCLMFSVCMALRLARFNAAIDNSPSHPFMYNFFTGVPAPMGAALGLMPVLLGLEGRYQGLDWLEHLARSPLICAPVLIGVAALLVSTLPVWSFKNFKIPSQFVLPAMLGVPLFAAFLVSNTWATMLAMDLIYLVLLPLSRRSFHRLRREAEAEAE